MLLSVAIVDWGTITVVQFCTPNKAQAWLAGSSWFLVSIYAHNGRYQHRSGFYSRSEKVVRPCLSKKILLCREDQSRLQCRGGLALDSRDPPGCFMSSSALYTPLVQFFEEISRGVVLPIPFHFIFFSSFQKFCITVCLNLSHTALLIKRAHLIWIYSVRCSNTKSNNRQWALQFDVHFEMGAWTLSMVPQLSVRFDTASKLERPFRNTKYITTSMALLFLVSFFLFSFSHRFSVTKILLSNIENLLLYTITKTASRVPPRFYTIPCCYCLEFLKSQDIESICAIGFNLGL